MRIGSRDVQDMWRWLHTMCSATTCLLLSVLLSLQDRGGVGPRAVGLLWLWLVMVVWKCQCFASSPTMFLSTESSTLVVHVMAGITTHDLPWPLSSGWWCFLFFFVEVGFPDTMSPVTPWGLFVAKAVPVVTTHLLFPLLR